MNLFRPRLVVFALVSITWLAPCAFCQSERAKPASLPAAQSKVTAPSKVAAPDSKAPPVNPEDAPLDDSVAAAPSAIDSDKTPRAAPTEESANAASANAASANAASANAASANAARANAAASNLKSQDVGSRGEKKTGAAMKQDDFHSEAQSDSQRGEPHTHMSHHPVELAGENFEQAHSQFDYLAFWRSFQDDETRKIDNGFMRQALVSGVLVALLCGFIGIYVVLKRIVFVSVALAEMSSAGIALGLLLDTPRLPPIWCASVFTLLGVALFSVHWTPRRVPRDSYIGILYAVSVALGILLIARSAEGEGHMLTLLQGDILTVPPAEVLQMAIAFALVALVHGVFYKEFVLVSFDRDQAAILGFRAAWWDFLLFLTVGIVISFAIRAVGILLATAMLLLPAVIALLLTRRLRHAFVVAPLVALLPVPFGLHFSLLRDLPPSPLTVALLFGLLVPAMLYSALKN